jgi:transposase
MIQMMRRRYSEDFKARAVELVRVGKSVPEAAQELGIGTGILYRWVGKVNKTAEPGGEGLGTGGDEIAADEFRSLRRENARLKLENDILKKAAVILGTHRPPNAER